jgi:hypothetical protein
VGAIQSTVSTVNAALGKVRPHVHVSFGDKTTSLVEHSEAPGGGVVLDESQTRQAAEIEARAKSK